MTNTMDVNIMYLGGAPGSDSHWMVVAALHKHKIIHYSFNRHKISPHFRVVLTDEELKKADEFLVEANKVLKRSLGKNDYIKNLLRRNYYQIKQSDSLYAIAESFNGDVKKLGGTAWAVVMFLHERSGGTAYIFSQSDEKWFSGARGEQENTFQWTEIKKPKKPSGKYTAIGTRKLKSSGRSATFSLFE